jgi:hypothetical protein
MKFAWLRFEVRQVRVCKRSIRGGNTAVNVHELNLLGCR